MNATQLPNFTPELQVLSDATEEALLPRLAKISGAKILVVEDEPDVIRALTMRLVQEVPPLPV